MHVYNETVTKILDFFLLSTCKTQCMQLRILVSSYMFSFSEDHSLYRAKILSVEDSKFEIRYIDYGNCETKLKEELLELPVSLSSAPAFSWQVNLPIMAGVENSKENQVRLDELLTSEGIKLKMISEESGEITIFGNQIDPALFPSSKKVLIMFTLFNEFCLLSSHLKV